MEPTYKSLLAAAKQHLVAKQRLFNTAPNAINWNTLTAAMFAFQQVQFAAPSGLRSRDDVVKACEGKPCNELADAIAVAIYGEPWAALQKEFFV